MISVEIRINGSLIAVIHAKNMGVGAAADRGDLREYEWVSTRFPTGLDSAALSYIGVVRHGRDDGVVELARILCEAHVEAEYDEHNK